MEEIGKQENISICIRVRPLNEREIRKGESVAWRCLPSMNAITMIDSEGKSLGGNGNVFQFDHIYGSESSNEDVFNSIGKRIVKSTVNGINGTIFAYGQTSSGKTHTMLGNSSEMGILQRSVNEIFDCIENSIDRDFLIRVSFIEIYNEVIQDLLVDGGQNVKIRENRNGGVYMECKEEIITDISAIMNLVHLGNQRRTVGSTAMNEQSSRSHSIFRIVIESKQKSLERRSSEDDVTGAVLVASLNLVDLAGSESVRHTAAEGIRQREAGNINRSLLTLSRVITALGQPSLGQPPFRDSKLTRLLQQSLGGNTRTVIVCCITPSEHHKEETRSTLQFAGRARNIRVSVEVNEVLDDEAQLKKLKKELHQLRKRMEHPNPEVFALKAQNEALALEKREQSEKIKRLQELIVSRKTAALDATVDDLEMKANRKSKRARRHRETWCPGDKLPTPMEILAAFEDIPHSEVTECEKTTSNLLNNHGVSSQINKADLALNQGVCLEQENQILKEKLETSLKEYEQLLQKTQIENSNPLNHQKEIQTLSEKILSQENTINQQYEEILSLNHHYKEDTEGFKKDFVLQVEKKYAIQEQDYNAQISQYEHTVATLKQENQEYQEKQAEHQEKLAEYQEKQAEYQEKLAEYQEKQAEHQEKQAEHQEKLAEYQEKQAEYQEKLAEYQEKQAVLELQEQKLAEYQEKLAVLELQEQKVQEYQHTILQLQEQEGVLKHYADAVVTECKEQEEMVAQLKIQLKASQDNLQEFTSHSQQQESETKQAMEKLEFECQMHRNHTNKLNEENLTLKQELDKTRMEYEEAKEKVEGMELRIQNEVAIEMDIHKEMDTYKELVEKLTTDLKQLQLELDQKESELQTVLHEKKLELEEINRESTLKFTLELDHLNKVIQTKEEEYSILLEKIEAEREMAQRREEEQQHIIEKLQEEFQKTKPESEQLEKDYHALQLQLIHDASQNQVVVKELQDQLSLLQEELTNVTREKDNLEETTEKTLKEQELFHVQIEKLKQENEDLIQNKEDIMKKHEDFIQNKEDIIKEQEDFIQNKEDLIKEQEDFIQNKEDLIKKQEDIIKTLENELEVMRNRAATNQTEVQVNLMEQQELEHEGKRLQEVNHQLMEEIRQQTIHYKNKENEFESIVEKQKSLELDFEKQVLIQQELQEKLDSVVKQLEATTEENEVLRTQGLERTELANEERKKYEVELELANEERKKYEVELELANEERKKYEAELELAREAEEKKSFEKDTLIQQELQEKLDSVVKQLETTTEENEVLRTQGLERTELASEIERNYKAELELASDNERKYKAELESVKVQSETNAQQKEQSMQQEWERKLLEMETRMKDLNEELEMAKEREKVKEEEKLNDQIASKKQMEIQESLVCQLTLDLQSERSQLKEMQKKLESELDQSQVKLGSQESNIHGLKAELDQLRQHLEMQERDKDAALDLLEKEGANKDILIEQFKEEINQIKCDMESMLLEKESIFELKDDLVKTKEKLHNSISEIEDHEENTKNLIRERDLVHQELERVKLESDRQEDLLKQKLDNILSEYQQRENLFQQRLEEMTIEHEKQERLFKEQNDEKLFDLQKHEAMLKQKLDQARGDQHAAEEVISDYKMRCNELQEVIVEKMKAIDFLAREKDQLSHQLGSGGGVNEKLHQQLKEAQTLVMTQKKRIDTLEKVKMTQDVLERISAIKDENNRLKKQAELFQKNKQNHQDNQDNQNHQNHQDNKNNRYAHQHYAGEQERKISCLEKENLDLLLELKELKKSMKEKRIPFSNVQTMKSDVSNPSSASSSSSKANLGGQEYQDENSMEKTFSNNMPSNTSSNTLLKFSQESDEKPSECAHQ